MSLVSVIIPAYNAEKYLTQAIESVLSQDYHNIELILVDDGSTDQTKNIATKYSDKIKLISKIHSGIGETRNTGLANARGDFIAFLDADDYWLSRKTSLQVSKLIGTTEIVFGKLQNFISPELKDFDHKVNYPKGEQLGFHPGAMLAKKSVFDRLGGFRADLQVGEFVDWFSRVKENKVNYIMLDDLVLMRRVHELNTTRQVSNPALEYLKVIKSRLKGS